ncbi:MAG: TlpA disulfide reductase family protein [Gammaproteobacteria bacterium]
MLLILQNTADAIAAKPGEDLPACELVHPAVSEIMNLEAFRGKVIYVDFWASWCPPCAKSFPFMNQLVEEYKGKGLEVIGINMDESADEAAQFLAEHPARFAVMTDPDKSCAHAFDVKAMPSSYLIDRNGVIRHIHYGFRSGAADELKKNIEMLLAGTLEAE